MARVTLNKINKALSQYPELKGVELVRANGYFCFIGNTIEWEETGVYGTFRLNDMTIDEWVKEALGRVCERKNTPNSFTTSDGTFTISIVRE